MAVPRQQIVKILRRAGLQDAAAAALATLPEIVDDQAAQQFCTEYGLLSAGSLMDRMGGSP
jgi:hypothetical protein